MPDQQLRSTKPALRPNSARTQGALALLSGRPSAYAGNLACGLNDSSLESILMKYLGLRRVSSVLGVVALLSCFVPAAWSEDAAKVTVCQLREDPEKYNHRLVEVTALVTYGFEDFSVADPTCSSWLDIWLQYGGTFVSPDRQRQEQFSLEDVPVPLVDDRNLREFYRLTARASDSVTRATIVGRFFAGRQGMFHNNRSKWAGYGHLGCCSLLAIVQVLSVDSSGEDRTDLDYRAFADSPKIDKAGCSIRDLLDIAPFKEEVDAQLQFETENMYWELSNPMRVGQNALARALKMRDAALIKLKQSDLAQGRFVYEWRPKGSPERYTVVVSRPYLLTFYSKDPNKIPWVAIAVFKSFCGVEK